MSVNSKGIAVHNYVHLVNLHFHQLKKNLIKLQSAVILPSNDIDHSSFNSPGGGESEKIKKGGLAIVLFHFFQGLSFLHLEITLRFAKLCYAFEEKNIFSATIILGKSSF